MILNFRTKVRAENFLSAPRRSVTVQVPSDLTLSVFLRMLHEPLADQVCLPLEFVDASLLVLTDAFGRNDVMFHSTIGAGRAALITEALEMCKTSTERPWTSTDLMSSGLVLAIGPILGIIQRARDVCVGMSF